MRLTSFLQNKELTIVLSGEIDHHCAKEYISAIHSKLEIYEPAVCILDFSDVTFMDSSGIAVVINTMRYITRLGGTMKLLNPGSQPMKVFATSGIDKLIEIMEVKNEV